MIGQDFASDDPAHQNETYRKSGMQIAPDQHHQRDQPQPVNSLAFVKV